MGGHTDLTAGCVSFVNKELMKKARSSCGMLGSILVRDDFYRVFSQVFRVSLINGMKYGLECGTE